MMRALPIFLMLLLLSGCGRQYEQMIGDKPMSPTGSGLASAAADVDTVASIYPAPTPGKSSWIGGPADYFRDRRAHQAGDILTVDILINDKASLSNTSNRSRKASSAADLGLTYDLMGVVGADVNGKGDVNSSSSQAGQGTTARAEKIELAIAAVVTKVLPNGYLMIKGSQEIQVNAETRVLTLSGIVHPRDIADNGRLAYDRIAEARISYGGNGTLTDVQKPGWGQRLWDRITPF
jgi:flagellar L-ring protein FlgH